MTELDLYTFITKHKLGVLGTICQGGTPQSALVGIAVMPQLEIIFDTVSTSRKYPNLISRPACSLVIGGGALANRPSNTKARLNISRRRH